VLGWDRASDVLNILDAAGNAIADAGAPGLADDFDALVTVSFNGASAVLTTIDGTRITFSGTGSGAASVADLVADPLTQLISDPALYATAFA